MNIEPKQELRSAIEVFSDVENATVGLEELPHLLQLLVDNYDLDSREFTEKQVLDLGMSHNTLYSTIFIVQHTLWDMSEKLSKISIKKDLDQEDAETTK